MYEAIENHILVSIRELNELTDGWTNQDDEFNLSFQPYLNPQPKQRL